MPRFDPLQTAFLALMARQLLPLFVDLLRIECGYRFAMLVSSAAIPAGIRGAGVAGAPCGG
jgi:hypothetical protein